MTTEADALARLNLAIAANRVAGANLESLVREQEENTKRLRAAVNELRAHQYRNERGSKP